MDLISVGSLEVAAELQGETPFAVLKPMCEQLGIEYSRQVKKLKSKHWAVMGEMPTTGSDGKIYRMVCISADTIPYWVMTINAGKVAPDVRDALKVLQLEGRDALYRHVTGQGTGNVMQDIASMKLDIAELQKQLITLTSKVAETQSEQLKLTKEIFAHVRRIEDQTKGKRCNVSAANIRRYASLIHQSYNQCCPICLDVRIVDDTSKRIPYVAEVDHFFHRSMNALEECWLVCKGCNSKLRTGRKPNGFWFQVSPTFQEFQRRLAIEDDGQLILF